MSRILQAVHKALRMAGVEAVDLPQDPRLSAVVAMLRSHGLRLAVVDAEQPSCQVSARWLLRRAFERAVAAGEIEQGLIARLSRLVDRDHSRVTRALRGEAGLDEAAVDALEEHLLDPQKRPLPPPGTIGRPRG